mmetsp:Transcript_3312/g.4576  ORF Transcript_3312/g.4576 Transcript_3312/m.4576 type:complete len:245 (+) Transcript_3312:1147-1881(+)
MRPLCFMSSVLMLRICMRPSLLGSVISMWISSRPGRRMASSIMSFRLVMPMMRMLFRLSTPSILDSSWFTMLSDTPVESRVEPLDFMMASISSKMMMCSMLASPCSRCSFSASANSARIFSSDPPTYLSSTSGPLMIFGSLAFSTFPICLAMRVLPQPGGPYSRIPRMWLMPSCFTIPGKILDAKAVRNIFLNCSSKPPMPSCSKLKSLRNNESFRSREVPLFTRVMLADPVGFFQSILVSFCN